MDIFDFISSPIKNLIQIGVTVFVSGVVFTFIKKEISKIREGFFLEVNSKIKDIDDPDVKEIVRHAIRYGAKRMPNASGSDRLNCAIRAIQDATPNWFITDESLRALIQDEYDKLKVNLELV